MPTNKQKKEQFIRLLTSIVDGLDDFPKPLKMLAKTAAKQIDEHKIDSIIDGTLDFLANAYEQVEAIKGETIVEENNGRSNVVSLERMTG